MDIEKVASIIRHVDRESTINWLAALPKKYEMNNINKLLQVVRKGQYLLWTDEFNLKILKPNLVISYKG